MSTISPPVMTSGAAGDVGLDQLPPGERYYRHPGDVIRLILWAAGAVLLALLIELAPGTSTGMAEDLGGAAGSVPRAVPRVPARGRPAERRPRPGGRRRGAADPPSLAPHCGAHHGGSRRRAADDGSRCRPRHAGAGSRGVARGRLAHLDPIPDPVVRRRGVGSRGRRQTVAGPRLASRGRPRRDRAHRHDGRRRQLERARSCSSPSPSAAQLAPRCSSCSVLPTAGRRRRWWRSTLRDAGLAVTDLSLERAGRRAVAALSHVGGRRVTLLRQGLRPGQSRRRSALPRLPHDRVPRLQRRTAGDDAGARRRARSAAADARPRKAEWRARRCGWSPRCPTVR